MKILTHCNRLLLHLLHRSLHSKVNSNRSHQHSSASLRRSTDSNLESVRRELLWHRAGMRNFDTDVAVEEEEEDDESVFKMDEDEVEEKEKEKEEENPQTQFHQQPLPQIPPEQELPSQSFVNEPPKAS